MASYATGPKLSNRQFHCLTTHNRKGKVLCSRRRKCDHSLPLTRPFQGTKLNVASILDGCTVVHLPKKKKCGHCMLYLNSVDKKSSCCIKAVCFHGGFNPSSTAWNLYKSSFYVAYPRWHFFTKIERNKI